MSNAVETEIRALVRELLRDMVPQRSLSPRPGHHTVRVTNSADLTRFANLVLDLARDSAVERNIRSGAYSFLLESHAPGDIEAPKAPVIAPVMRIDKGAVTEKIVTRAAASGTRLELGPRVVITPLAKEAARKNGVGIERIS